MLKSNQLSILFFGMVLAVANQVAAADKRTDVGRAKTGSSVRNDSASGQVPDGVMEFVAPFSPNNTWAEEDFQIDASAPPIWLEQFRTPIRPSDQSKGKGSKEADPNEVVFARFVLPLKCERKVNAASTTFGKWCEKLDPKRKKLVEEANAWVKRFNEGDPSTQSEELRAAIDGSKEQRALIDQESRRWKDLGCLEEVTLCGEVPSAGCIKADDYRNCQESRSKKNEATIKLNQLIQSQGQISSPHSDEYKAALARAELGNWVLKNCQRVFEEVHSPKLTAMEHECRQATEGKSPTIKFRLHYSSKGLMDQGILDRDVFLHSDQINGQSSIQIFDRVPKSRDLRWRKIDIYPQRAGTSAVLKPDLIEWTLPSGELAQFSLRTRRFSGALVEVEASQKKKVPASLEYRGNSTAFVSDTVGNIYDDQIVPARVEKSGSVCEIPDRRQIWDPSGKIKFANDQAMNAFLLEKCKFGLF